MYKIKYLMLIILISFLQHVNCEKFDLKVRKKLAYLSERTGFCSEWFQYLSIDGFIVGKLTLPNLKLGDTVKLEFFYKNLWMNMGRNGSVLPDDTSEEIINRLQTDQAISFRVDFPITDDIPILDLIFINDNEFCGALFDLTGDKLLMEYTLQITNGSLEVFKYNNNNIPYFAEVSNCELNVMANTTNVTTKQMNVRRSEYPWLAALFKKEETVTVFICSGSLLTSALILTAAHCFQSLDLTAEKFVAHLGRHNLANNQEENVVVRDIVTILLHPEYNAFSSFSDADLALLKMQTTVSFTEYIQPICLWSETADEALIDGHSSMMVGWTSIEEYENTTSTIPKMLKTYIVPQAECLRSSSIYSTITSSRTLCVKKRIGFEPCMRGLGGGLILKRNGRWMLRGIISAGLTPQKNCDSQEYTVSSDIADHLSWLANYIGEHSSPATGSLQAICGVAGAESRTAHPWLAVIYKKTFTHLFYACTGTLISSRTVLAAAHCFKTAHDIKTVPAYEFRIYLGRHDLDDITERGIVTREVETLVQHPKYSDNTVGLFYNFDIVLLQMSAAVSFTEFVKPICLWTEPAAVQLQIIGESVTLASWDYVGVFSGNYTVPKSMAVNVVPMRQCNLEGYNGDILSRFLCTPRFGNNVDGILMMRRNDGRYMLRGLSSANLLFFGIYNRRKFRVYSDLAEYMFWIRSNMLL